MKIHSYLSMREKESEERREMLLESWEKKKKSGRSAHVQN